VGGDLVAERLLAVLGAAERAHVDDLDGHAPQRLRVQRLANLALRALADDLPGRVRSWLVNPSPVSRMGRRSRLGQASTHISHQVDPNHLVSLLALVQDGRRASGLVIQAGRRLAVAKDHWNQVESVGIARARSAWIGFPVNGI